MNDPDGLGSTTGLTDENGALTDTYSYDVFGAERSHTGSSPTELTYTGEQNDPSGLEYLRARYYDPSTGRFLSKDPVPYLQRYAYVFNSPTNLVDPSGLSPLGDQLGETAQALSDCAVEASRLNDAAATMCRDLLAEILALEAAFIASFRDAVRDAADRLWDVTFDYVHLQVDLTAYGFYAVYYGSYQALGLINRLPNATQLKVNNPLAYGLLLGGQYVGLGGNVAMDAVESKVLGVDEPILEDRHDGPILPKQLIDVLGPLGKYVPGTYLYGCDEHGCDLRH